VNFDPVAGAQGQQNKMAGTVVPVTVTDNSATCGGGGGGGGGGTGDRPAAPAVANAYLNASDSTVLSACKAAVGGAKSWRGDLISFIASSMPKPESNKEAPPVGAFTSADDWISYVVSEVNTKCADGIAPTFDPTTIPGLPGYTT